MSDEHISDEARSEQYILDGSRQWAEALASGNVVDVERIIADDFVGVDPSGNVYDKAALIDNARAGPKHFALNEIGQVTVRFFGETAVAQGEESWVRHQGSPRRGRFVWLDTWVRRNGLWQIVAAQDAIAAVRVRDDAVSPASATDPPQPR